MQRTYLSLNYRKGVLHTPEDVDKTNHIVMDGARSIFICKLLVYVCFCVSYFFVYLTDHPSSLFQTRISVQKLEGKV